MWGLRLGGVKFEVSGYFGWETFGFRACRLRVEVGIDV